MNINIDTALSSKEIDFSVLSSRCPFKVQSCKLYNNHMIASTQVRNIEISVFIAVLVFKLLSRKVLFINRKDKINCLKVGYFF